MTDDPLPRFAHWRDDARDWCTGRPWTWRAAVAVVLAWQAGIAFRDPEGFHVFRGITFGAHEFGHLFFSLFGNEWLAVAGGSLMQFLIPIGAAAVMRYHRDWFGVAMCGLWLASSFADLAPYIADARATDLDLVSFSEEGAVHDWHFLLGKAGLLLKDQAIARFVRFAGFLVLSASLVLGVWLVRQMRAHPGTPRAV